MPEGVCECRDWVGKDGVRVATVDGTVEKGQGKGKGGVQNAGADCDRGRVLGVSSAGCVCTESVSQEGVATQYVLVSVPRRGDRLGHCEMLCFYLVVGYSRWCSVPFADAVSH